MTNINKIEQKLTEASRQWVKVATLIKELNEITQDLKELSKQNHIINPYKNE